MFSVILSENLKELIQKDVFETIFCLHEVGSFLNVCSVHSMCNARVTNKGMHSFTCGHSMIILFAVNMNDTHSELWASAMQHLGSLAQGFSVLLVLTI